MRGINGFIIEETEPNGGDADTRTLPTQSKLLFDLIKHLTTSLRRIANMVGFEILVEVPRDKRQEFIQTCELLGDASCRAPACLQQTLFENVTQSNQFLWVEHWNDPTLMDAHLKSGRFGVLLGAIAVLGESNRLLRLETEDLEGS